MTSDQISVLICDDQAVVREGLAAILGTVPHLQVVGLADQGQEALALVAQHLHSSTHLGLLFLPKNSLCLVLT